jgi:integrase
MVDFFGMTTPIAKIDSALIGKWRDHRIETVSGSTVQREANLLRHLFTLACDEWRLIDRNPFKGVRLPKETPARHQIWRWKQIRQVLRAGQRSGDKTKQVALAFHIALRTGMRLQEALAAPANLDVVRKVVTVPTKTTSRPEEIPVGRIAVKLLQAAKFTVEPNEASVLFGKLARSQMIKDLTFHDARATALTLLAKKVDIMVLARISRHKDISLLHRVYYRASAQEIAAKL